ncbi:MAG: CDP-diacylglycerol--glycerol-3-phosphate 3-phosphatidyltransferase [Spirochaetaceae bacterium]|jgi:CDP-diacylglycerol--glycerol-3-phosphate 3-phosphatidyltransferase|nr:CDP-diacylglycerol--glycerol-3-phosphate 3-phosphatidyltransferase [Spirochaetaceae bacterium]
MRIADKFTLARMIFAPIFFVIYQISDYFSEKNPSVSLYILVFLVFALILAELTDFFDGFFARKRGEVSDAGKLFDPFADALLHITTFFCFVSSNLMPPAAFILIFWREFSQMFLRMMSIKDGVAVAARFPGKLKTVIYIVSGFYALVMEIAVKMEFIPYGGGFFAILLRVLFWVCVVFAYVSFADYLVLFKNRINRV